MTEGGSPAVNASEGSTESEAETAALLEAEVDEAIATCGGDVRAVLRATLIANAYLEAEFERLIDAVFARGRMRKATSTKADEDLDVEIRGILIGGVLS
jgi:hypothetical protein